jgi:dTDP-4-dehydrorhamnose reductase
MPPRILVFGATGQIGRALIQAPWPDGTALIALGRDAADLSHPAALPAIVRSQSPDIVIIAAGYTQVDRAESEEAVAMAVNAGAPAAIAEAAAALSVPVVYFSTDYVFDGTKAGWYEEDDPVRPLNAYGRTKLAGEVAVADSGARHLILRTSWVYSASGANFLTAMLARAGEAEVRVVADQAGCPTAARDVADALAAVLPRLLEPGVSWGTYHLAGASAATWHGFAEAIFAGLEARGRQRPRVVPVTSVEYPRPAKRPQNSRLSSDAFALEFGLRLPGWEEALPEILDKALAASPDGLPG